MAVCVFIDDCYEQSSETVKVDLSENLPFMSKEDFEYHGYHSDENGHHYEIVHIYNHSYPEVTFTINNWRELVYALDVDDIPGYVTFEFLPILIRRCLYLTNSNKIFEQTARSYCCNVNDINYGTCVYSIKKNALLLLPVLVFAQSKKKGVCWTWCN